MRETVILVVVAAVFVLFVGGCQKTFTVEFTNLALEDLEISFEGPGQVEPAPRGILIAGDGGSARFVITVLEDDLPRNYHWQAGQWKGAVVVRLDSDNLRFVDIGRAGPSVTASPGPAFSPGTQTVLSP